MTMYILADFAYKNPDWMKVLNKWEKATGELKPKAKNYDRSYVIDRLKNSLTDQENKLDFKFLKKEYKDPKTNKNRKLVTGIAGISENTPSKIDVQYLVGNPKADKNPKFKGALNSLDKKVGNRKISMVGLSKKVDDMYKKKFGDRLV
jgi:hypothetical protein